MGWCRYCSRKSYRPCRQCCSRRGQISEGSEGRWSSAHKGDYQNWRADRGGRCGRSSRHRRLRGGRTSTLDQTPHFSPEGTRLKKRSQSGPIILGYRTVHIGQVHGLEKWVTFYSSMRKEKLCLCLPGFCWGCWQASSL